MSPKSHLVGMQLPPVSLAVERGKIREFAGAIGDPNPVYYDPEEARKQGYRDVIAPPTFGTVIDLWGGKDFTKICSLLDMNPVMVLHGEHEYTYFGEINPAEEITATTMVDGYQEKKGLHLYKLVTDYVNQRGELVLKSRHTIVERKAD